MGTHIEITNKDIAEAAVFAINALEQVGICEPNADDCRSQEFHEYIWRLARRLRQLEDEQDDFGLDELWFAYGYRDCLKALHIIEAHADQL